MTDELSDFGAPEGGMLDVEGGGFDAGMGETSGDMPDMADMGQEAAAGAEPDRRKKKVLGVPIEVVVTVGRARPLLSELVALRRDSVLPLDSKIDDPVEVIIGDKVIARGELQEIEPGSGKLGVRLTEVADLSQTV